MIEIPELSQADVGRWVMYKTSHSNEIGKIKSWNNEWIFVVYKCANEWHRFKEFTGCATDPEDLFFIKPEEIENLIT